MLYTTSLISSLSDSSACLNSSLLSSFSFLEPQDQRPKVKRSTRQIIPKRVTFMGLFFKAPQFYYNFLNPEQKSVYFIDKPLYKRHYSTDGQKKYLTLSYCYLSIK